MNYFTDETALGGSIRSLGFGLTSYEKEKRVYKGVAK
jgi:hypothetical protein